MTMTIIINANVIAGTYVRVINFLHESNKFIKYPSFVYFILKIYFHRHLLVKNFLFPLNYRDASSFFDRLYNHMALSLSIIKERTLKFVIYGEK